MSLTSAAKNYAAFFITLSLYMITFIKDSMRELQHVVWPTRKETSNFFVVVVIILILFGLYLFIASQVFSEILFTLRNIVTK
jgi:preprotein translocase SecE subunit